MEKGPVNIGKSVVIKGELNGSEDLTIEGQVEGKIELRQNVLTIGPNGKIKAQVFAKSVIVLGEVTGNVTATEKVDIRDNGSVDGDIVAPRVAIAEGAHFRGSIDMQRGGGKPGEPQAGAEGRRVAAGAEPAAAAPPQPAQAVATGRSSGAAAGRESGRPTVSAPEHAGSWSPCRCPICSSVGGKRPDARAGRRRGAATLAAPDGAGACHAVQGAPEVPRRARRTAQSPVLLDLGPVVGDQRRVLRRAARLQDLHRGSRRRDRPARARRHARRRCRRSLAKRFTQADGSVDGMLCWDIFDYLDRPRRRRWPRSSCAMLRPGGAVMGFFSTEPIERGTPFTKYEIVDESQSLRHRHHPGAGGAEARAAEPRHHRMFERPARLRLVPAQEQHPRDPAPQAVAPRIVPDPSMRPLIALLTDFGTRGSLRRDDEGRRSSASVPTRRWSTSPTTFRRTTCSPARSSWPPPTAIFPPAPSSSSVVDPGVGSARRGIAAEAGDYRFVAPDNGVLTQVLPRDAAEARSSS